MHLVVQRTVRSRMMSFGDVIKKVRTFTIKYRQSPKAKAFLFELYQRRLPGFIDIRWSVFFNLEFFVLPFLTRWSELLSMKAYQELAEQPGDLPGQLIKHMKWDKPPQPHRPPLPVGAPGPCQVCLHDVSNRDPLQHAQFRDTEHTPPRVSYFAGKRCPYCFQWYFKAVSEFSKF